MATNTNIRPLRDFSEHEVLPTFYAWNPSGAYPQTKGIFVKIISGASADNTVGQIGDVGAHYQNVVSQRYGVPAFVGAVTNSGDSCIGMTLYDVRELDENGEKLILHPDKMERMQAIPSGWPVPILRRGFVQWSGLGSASNIVGQGESAYLSPANDGTISASGNANVSTKIGRFMGPRDSQGFVYLFVDVY